MADMKLSTLAEDLRDSIHATADVFTAPENADFKRLIQTAALYMHLVRPLIKRAEINLTPNQYDYPAPDDCVRVKSTKWGRAQRLELKPWDNAFPKVLPTLQLVETINGRFLEANTLPSAKHLACHGSVCQYYYQAQHKVDEIDANTTVRPQDRALLLLRAQAEVCLELSLKGLNRPLAINSGFTKSAIKGNPQILAERLIKMWHQAARGE